ncbi:MAG: CHAT domain-containing protein [Spirochaetes bacterium]|nr:CHAT domain-containing protein [Spirochaetota bacterium]
MAAGDAALFRPSGASLLLSHRSVKPLLRKGAEYALFVYDIHHKKVFGPYGAAVDRIRKRKNGLYAVPLTQERCFRRGCFHDAVMNAGEAVILDDTQAKRLYEKLSAAQNTAPSVLMSARFASGRFSCRYIELGHDTAIIDHKTDVRPSAVNAVIREVRDIMAQPMGELRQRKRLEVIGGTLFSLLFPDVNMQRFVADASKTIHLDLDAKAAELPWEIIASNGRFIARETLLAHAPHSPIRHRKAPERISFAVISIPHRDLPDAERESAALAELARSFSHIDCTCISRPLSVFDMHGILSSHDVVHVITHGINERGVTAWSIGAKKYLYARDVPTLASAPALVVANVCETARVPVNDRRHIIPAIMYAGTSTVIAANGALADAHDGAFLGELYRNIFSGEPAGVAYRAAVIESERSAFLRYRFFGNHTVRLARRA